MVELDSIELMPIVSLGRGDIARDFSVTTLDGDPIKLSDLRGKVVVLDFWATWCGPCVVEMPQVKEAFEHFAESKDVVFIGMSLDAKPDVVRSFAEKHDLRWLQVHLGGFDSNPITPMYGVHGIPRLMVIDRTGIIHSDGVRVAAIIDTVEQARKTAGR